MIVPNNLVAGNSFFWTAPRPAGVISGRV